MSSFTENPGVCPVATLHDAWLRSVRAHPDKDAIRDSHGTVFTYAEVDLLASRVARYLCDCGVEAGDVVSCQLPGWAEFLPIYMACMKIGAVVNPIPPNLRFHELKQMLRRCGSKILFLPRTYRKFTYCGMAGDLRRAVPQVRAIIAVDKFGEGSSLPSFRQIVEEDIAAPLRDEEIREARAGVGADDPAAIVFTSGSEGEAKGVILSHRNILAAERAFTTFFSLDEHDIMFMAAPIAHAIGFHHGVTMPFLVGATSILQDRFVGTEALELMERHRATVTMASSSFLYDMLLAHRRKRYDMSALRFFLCGGSPADLAMSREALGFGMRVLNVYGATESVPHMGTPPGGTLEQLDRLALFPMPGVRVRVVDARGNAVPDGEEGEEVSSSDAVFQGYIGMPEATARALENGWYHSGDLCRRNSDGSYTITGRIKDVIVRGGENISSLEVETILLKHDNIREAAVVSMPDARLQERICAYIVLKDPSRNVSFEDITELFSRNNVAKQKFPEHLEFVGALPKTPSGKIRKALLREDIAKKMAARNGDQE